ncbi:FMN phosphatase YigB (HAD superfamily) [Sporosarcina luteola]|nr:FMN phosphatase YigB (HAD superfamily) [Sporosarcina luteola]
MMNWLDELKVVIFDLDGTLYQDDAFLGRYIGYMLEEMLDETETAEVVMEAYDMLDGSHSVPFGCFFDREQHVVYEHENFEPTASFTWEGMKRNAQEADPASLLFVGDVWCVAHVFAEKYKVPVEKRAMAFEKVRFEMIRQPHGIRLHSPLFESIRALDVERKIFMTNTPGETGPAFVHYLNIGTLFNDFVFGAKKPVGMEKMVKSLIEEGYAPHEILSVGDNPFNDLLPVKQLGGRTCLISPYTHFGQHTWDGAVKTVEELAIFLRQPSTVNL